MIVRELVTLLGYELDDKKLTTYEQQTTNVMNGLSKAATFVKRAIAAVGVYRLGKSFLSAAASMEQTQISFETLLNSQDKAKSMIADLMQMAAITPYSETDLINGAKLFLNYGVSAEKILPIMSQLSDVASGSAQKLYSLSLNMAQTMATGRLLGGDLRSMVNAGFNPLQEISRTTGKSMAYLTKQMQDSKISAEMVLEAFKTATSKGGRFFNMSIKQSKTFSGMMSTAGDYLKGIARTIGAELLPPAKAVLSVFMDFLEANKGAITKVAVGAFRALAIAIAYVVVFFDELIKTLGGADKIFAWIGEQVDTFMVGLKAVWNVLKPFIPAILAITLALKGAAIAQALFNAVAAMNPIGLMVSAIVALIFALGLLLKNWDKVVAFFKKGLQSIGRWFTQVWYDIKRAAEDVWNFIAGIAIGVWNVIVEAVTLAWNTIVNVFKAVWGVISGLVSGWVAWFAQAWLNIKNEAERVWLLIVESIRGAWEDIKAAWGAAGEFFTGIWDGIKTAGVNVWQFITTAATTGWNGVKKAWSTTSTFFSTLWEGIKSGASTVWDGLKNGFQSAADWITGIWKGVETFFTGIWEKIAKFGEGVQKIFSALGIQLVAETPTPTTPAVMPTTPGTSPTTPKPLPAPAAKVPVKTATGTKTQGAPLPRYARGTDYVPETGLAMLERGESVLPPGVLAAFVAQKRETAKALRIAQQAAAASIQRAVPAINTVRPAMASISTFRDRIVERTAAVADRSPRASASSIRVDSTVRISVPSGTPEMQIGAVQRAAEKAVRDQWGQILRHTATQFTPLEAGG